MTLSFSAPVVKPEDNTAVNAAIPLTTDVIAIEEGGTVNQQRHGSAYRHIPEVRDLIWEDTFYDGDDSIVAVFDYDVEKRAMFWRRTIRTSLVCFSFSAVAFAVLGILTFILLGGITFGGIMQLLLAGYDAYLSVRLYKAMGIRADRHLAATTEGLRLDTRGTGDAHNTRVTIPYQDIDKCMSGKASNHFLFCCFSPRDFSLLNIKKVGATFYLKILGLKNADDLVKLVDAMKRGAAEPVSAMATLPVEKEFFVSGDAPQKDDVDLKRVHGDIV